MKHEFRIQNKNIELLPLEHSDIFWLRKWRNNSENTKFLRKIPYITIEDEEIWYESYLKNDNEMIFAIYENQVLNKIVGSLALYDFKQDGCTLGKILIGDCNAHHKRVGLNSVMGAVQIAFNDMKYDWVDLYVYCENIRALTIYRQAGFKIEKSYITGDGLEEVHMILRRKKNAQHK